MEREAGAAAGAGGGRTPMTRCECVELSFDEIARRLQQDGLSFEELQSRTGCGLLCTACLPDLRARLAGRR